MRSWVAWLGLGILSVVFGVLALANAVAASVAVTIVTGAMLLIAGGVQAAVGWREEGTGHRFLSVGLGLLMLLLGLSFLANPLQGTVSLALVVTILIAASGILRLALAWSMRATPFFWWMLLSGALSILLAGYILANFADVSVVLLGLLLGIELVFNGAGLIVLALFVRAVR
jgi:uncharacterized membrane protein HdeD (DUF308 family)